MRLFLSVVSVSLCVGCVSTGTYEVDQSAYRLALSVRYPPLAPSLPSGPRAPVLEEPSRTPFEVPDGANEPASKRPAAHGGQEMILIPPDPTQLPASVVRAPIGDVGAESGAPAVAGRRVALGAQRIEDGTPVYLMTDALVSPPAELPGGRFRVHTRRKNGLAIAGGIVLTAGVITALASSLWFQAAANERKNCPSDMWFGCLFAGLGDEVMGDVFLAFGLTEGLTGGMLALASLSRHPSEVPANRG